MVFLYHNRKYWRDQLHPELLRLINEMNTGVSLFFVLSGFLIAYTYQSKPAASLKDYSLYLLQRVARIYPIYVLILIAYYCDPGFGKGEASWLTFSLVHGLSSQYNLYGLGQAWSLTVEMCFYIMAPFMVLWLQKSRWLFVLGIVLIVLTMAGIGYSLDHTSLRKDHFLWPLDFLANGTLAGYIAEFSIGILLAAYLRSVETPQPLKLKNSSILLFLALFGWLYIIGMFQSNVYDHGTAHWQGKLMLSIGFSSTAALLFYSLITFDSWLSRFLASKPMVLLGNASFIFYLIHISYVNLKIRSWFLLPDRNFVVLWLLSIILYLFIERPFYGFVRKRIKSETAGGN